MLPLLPALILLLLQGPSNFERLAVNGRLPAALEAIQRQIVASESDSLTECEKQSFASILANHLGDPLSNALFAILQPIQAPTRTVVSVEDCESKRHVCEQGSLHLPTGFGSSDRTRDGPLPTV